MRRKIRVGDSVDTRDYKGKARRGKVYRIDRDLGFPVYCIEFPDGETIRQTQQMVNHAQDGEKDDDAKPAR